MNYQNLIRRYRKNQLNLRQKLVNTMQPEVDKFCKKWGFGFSVSESSWYLLIKDEAILGSGSITILDFFNSPLADALKSPIDDFRHKLGGILCDVEICEDDYEWITIVLETNMDKNKETIKFLSPQEASLLSEEEKDSNIFLYFEVTQQIADAIFHEYMIDSCSAIAVLRCFPTLNCLF